MAAAKVALAVVAACLAALFCLCRHVGLHVSVDLALYLVTLLVPLYLVCRHGCEGRRICSAWLLESSSLPWARSALAFFHSSVC